MDEYKETAREIKGTLELTVDQDHVAIPMARYTELLKAEIHLGLAKQIYDASKSYDLENRLSLLFGPKKDDGNA